jgi:hypothetical protein
VKSVAVVLRRKPMQISSTRMWEEEVIVVAGSSLAREDDSTAHSDGEADQILVPVEKKKELVMTA